MDCGLLQSTFGNISVSKATTSYFIKLETLMTVGARSQLLSLPTYHLKDKGCDAMKPSNKRFRNKETKTNANYLMGTTIFRISTMHEQHYSANKGTSCSPNGIVPNPRGKTTQGHLACKHHKHHSSKASHRRERGRVEDR